MSQKQQFYLYIYGLIKAGVVRAFTLEELDDLDFEFLPFVLGYQKYIDYIQEMEMAMKLQQMEMNKHK